MAKAGYFVVMPDLFLGNPCPIDAFTPGRNFDIMKWVGEHPKERIDGTVEAAIKLMRGELGVKAIGAVGYCFGGKYVIRFLAENKGLEAGFVAHPSLVDSTEVEAVRGPLSVAAAGLLSCPLSSLILIHYSEIDQVMPPEKRHETEAILQKLGHPYELTLYGGTEHGFAVRTDLGVKKKKLAMEGAYAQAIRWFDEWVKGGST